MILMCDVSLKLEEKTIPTSVKSTVKRKLKNKMLTTHMIRRFLSLLAYASKTVMVFLLIRSYVSKDTTSKIVFCVPSSKVLSHTKNIQNLIFAISSGQI